MVATHIGSYDGVRAQEARVTTQRIYTGGFVDLECMKGKRTFTKHEEKQLLKLIAEKVITERSQQKHIRQQMRDIGFYISDFTSSKQGFNLDDFKTLKKTGQIKIQ